ncbi:Homogentisate 1,2-dioxygenase [Nocardia sp. RB56]|uniref:Homogentisate 1,2-dioxygenase n=2 Tax=Nocardia aurantia TaxID=2585199 RepID=A0A7K0DQ52_9NOCA|nr:Homogentisate 1,2-dioxygenase [Nocardia aurantia]
MTLFAYPASSVENGPVGPITVRVPRFAGSAAGRRYCRRMAYYRQVGQIPPKRHTQFRAEDGALYREELMGEEGFVGDSALLYHRHIPSAVLAATEWEPGDLSLTPNRPLIPRHLRLPDLFAASDSAAVDVVTGRRLVLGNDDVRISYVVAGAPSPLYRNAIGDECVYLESGSGTVETVFGVLPFRPGDHVVVPRATTHRWLPDAGEPVRAYVIEANSHITPPARYLSRFGQLLEQAPYCERDLHGPAEPLLRTGTEVEILVKHRGPRGVTGTRHVVPHHPFDVVGWDGCLYPYTFNIADFEPITGRIHQPPPAHQLFQGANFVICNFVPRKVDYHPLAIPVPYYHSNVDSDEVMFYCGGDYAARRGSGIAAGSVSLHPGGHSHGPQPGAVERSLGAEFFDELAVMVDTFRPLQLGEGGVAADDGDYAGSWSRAGS